MKNSILALILVGAVACLSASPTTTSEPSPASTQARDLGRLWIAVHLPSSSAPSWVRDDTAEIFADHIAKALREQGFKGALGTLLPESSVASYANVLVVRLTNLATKDGIGACTFTASLRTRGGDRDVGVFTGESMVVTSDGKHRISSDGLVESAQEAMSGLFDRIQATGLLKPN